MNYEDLHSIEGLQFIPVNEKKEPLPKAWQTTKKKHQLNSYGVGIVCGGISGNLECIDVDVKYDLTGKMFERYKNMVHEIDENILPKMVVQKTRSGGYHLIYRCSKVCGNTKLANRPTTDEERDKTYVDEYAYQISVEKKDEITAKKIADKAKKNDKVRVLFETRGEGGQFVCHPTPGYEFVYGDLCSITEITPEERDVLFGIAMQFNQVIEEIVIPKSKVEKINGLSSFDDYNKRGDVVALLQEHGWKVVKQKGQKTIFLRPGQTTSQSSGNYDHDKKWFSVFTTSTEFEPQHAYLPYAVFATLECDKDFSLASKKLYELGYGEKQETKKTTTSTRVIESRIDPEKTDLSYFATGEDYNNYLQQVIDGTLKQGLTTGSPKLDEHFLFKEGNLVMSNGIDNVGKSEIVWWLLMLAAMLHEWRGVIFSSENTLGAFMRRMIQFYWGKPLRGDFAMSRKEYEVAKEFVEKHFLLIKAQEDLYSYKDIINLCKIARRTGDFKYAMIDPYNSLKINLSGFSKLSTHEYHYEALSEIKSYGQQTNFGWFINNHAVTSALRLKDADKKYPVAPRKEDTEGGGKFANKADDFFTVHRITQHPTEWMITELHIRKIKDTETGGRPTSIDMPIKFERYRGGYAYVERDEMGQRGIDPIKQWHDEKSGTTQAKIFTLPTNGYLPYKDDTGTEISF